MQSDYKPILYQTNPEFEEIEVYFAHDIHYGSAEHDRKKWEAYKADILSAPNRFVIFVGDYCENAVIGSKSDIYTQTASPHYQKEWFTQQLVDLRDRTICIVPGNHEDNRITKTCGLFPAYDCAKEAGLGDLYRHNFAFVDIGVGSSNSHQGRQARYVGYIVHRFRDTKMYNTSDFVDGIDFAAYGHDHDPKDHPRAKLVYDSKNKTVSHKNIEVIDSGAFLTYGGYGVKSAYRPTSTKCYKLILDGKRSKSMKTVGFYV